MGVFDLNTCIRFNIQLTVLNINKSMFNCYTCVYFTWSKRSSIPSNDMDVDEHDRLSNLDKNTSIAVLHVTVTVGSSTIRMIHTLVT